MGWHSSIGTISGCRTGAPCQVLIRLTLSAIEKILFDRLSYICVKCMSQIISVIGW